MKYIKEFFINFFKAIFGGASNKPIVVVPTPTEPTTPPDIIEKPSQDNSKWDLFFSDISHHEPDFNGAIYDRPILINKCTDGATFVDKTHAKRKEDCTKNNIKYGGYHFYQCYTNPISQAAHYVKTHGSFDLLPLIDYEKDKNQDENDLLKERENLFKMLVEVERLTGKVPVIYTYRSLLQNLNLDSKFKKYPIWLARYNNTMGVMPMPFDKTNLVAWQYSDGGETYKHPTYPNSFPSIGNCDSNVYDAQNDFFKLLK